MRAGWPGVCQTLCGYYDKLPSNMNTFLMSHTASLNRAEGKVPSKAALFLCTLLYMFTSHVWVYVCVFLKEAGKLPESFSPECWWHVRETAKRKEDKNTLERKFLHHLMCWALTWDELLTSRTWGTVFILIKRFFIDVTRNPVKCPVNSSFQ